MHWFDVLNAIILVLWSNILCSYFLESSMREDELRDLRTFEEECLTNLLRRKEKVVEGTQDEKLDAMTHS